MVKILGLVSDSSLNPACRNQQNKKKCVGLPPERPLNSWLQYLLGSTKYWLCLFLRWGGLFISSDMGRHKKNQVEQEKCTDRKENQSYRFRCQSVVESTSICICGREVPHHCTYRRQLGQKVQSVQEIHSL